MISKSTRFINRDKINDLLWQLGEQEVDEDSDDESFILEATLAFVERIDQNTKAPTSSKAIFSLFFATAIGAMLGKKEIINYDFEIAVFGEVFYPGKFIIIDGKLTAVSDDGAWKDSYKILLSYLDGYYKIIESNLDIAVSASTAVFDYFMSDGSSEKWNALIQEYILIDAYIKYLKE